MALKKTQKKDQKKNYDKMALASHKKMQGKLEVVSKGKLKTKDDWSTMYTPGVGAVSSHLAKHPEDARKYTIKKDTVAVVSDGSAVLGLGNIGPLGALPVMEGKCAIFKEMADVNAFPIVLDTQDTEEIIETVKRIAPGFGGINLEDISAPRCFEIEDRLKAELDIPVFHDDQHGTAIVVLAGLINSAKVVKKQFKNMRVVVIGSGAAGRAITLLLLKAGVGDVVMADSKGLLCTDRADLTGYKKELAEETNQKNVCGNIIDIICGSDAVVGVSGPNTIQPEWLECMAQDPIVFALANPVPEIDPADAKRVGARVIATGRSDYPNQINNSLVFPGIFRGALDKGVNAITDDMKIAAAKKLASMVKNPTPAKVIPSVMEKDLVKTIASAVKKGK